MGKKQDGNISAMEQHVCIVCGKAYDTGAILIDRQLRGRFKAMHAVTGHGLCPEHQKLFDDGYVALVGVDPTKSGPMGDKLKSDQAHRTGAVAHVRREVARQIFNVPIPDDQPMVFADDAVIKMLEQRQQEVDGE